MATGHCDPVRQNVVVPAVWRPFYDATHIPAGVWTGDMLRLSGHTGEDDDGVFSDDIEDQLRGTFRNIAITLEEAGTSWSHVVEINSYHVDYRRQAEALLRIAAEFLDAPYPVWTAIGVTELYHPAALVEIRCVVVVRSREP